MRIYPEKAEAWVQIGTALALDDANVKFSDAVKLFNAIDTDKIKPSCFAVEIRVVVSNGGTDPVDVEFYRTPEGNSSYRDSLPMGSTHGDWDHQLDTSASEVQSSRRLTAAECGSGVTVGVSRASGTTTDMTVDIYARRDRMMIGG